MSKGSLEHSPESNTRLESTEASNHFANQLNDLSDSDHLSSLAKMKSSESTYLDDFQFELADNSKDGIKENPDSQGEGISENNSDCVTGTATVFNPSNGDTASGKSYTYGNNAEGVAYPMNDWKGGDYSDASGLDLELGDNVSLENLENGKKTEAEVFDRGNFGHLSGEHGPRKVDLTRDTAKQLGFGPEAGGEGQIPIKVCKQK